MKTQKKAAALYMRLSRDDEQRGESTSIINQRKLLQQEAAKHGYTKTIEYVDDGYSGTTFDRPGFMKMEQDIEGGKISCVIVKDQSRLGRHQLKVGSYVGIFFPKNGVRFISVTEGTDSDEGEDDFVGMRSLINEMYARDASRKVKAAYRAKSMSGEPISRPPYGYKLDPNNKNRWIIDKEAASVVRRIYALFLEGKGVDHIANTLSTELILNPTSYWREKGISISGVKFARSPYAWNNSSIAGILKKQEYCGDIINFKTQAISFYCKTRVETPQENQMVFYGVHEPIISREDFERVQQKRKESTRVKRSVTGKNIFSGLVKCATCGNNLHFHFSQSNNKITYFSCSHYNYGRRVCTATHYVRVDLLEKVVLADIQRLVKCGTLDEQGLAGALIAQISTQRDLKSVERQKRIETLRRRESDLDALISRVFEDSTLGRISSDRTYKLIADYESEQQGITAQLETLEAEAKKFADKVASVDDFVKLIRKQAKVTKLSKALVNRFIDKIVVHHAKPCEGKKLQHIELHYNYVGAVTLPESPVPQPKVSLNTRRGVVVEYAPVSVGAG